ncbi:MAG: HAD family hydrolase [Deltaproteobacteria bacterium]|nr:HAD family hydrolase [Deltaproteobacteria bacterium]
MTTRLVILDFDGTFTDSEAEGAPFAERYPDLLAAAIGMDAAAFAPFFALGLQDVAAQSPELGWRINGVDAAPADADPYIRCSMAAHCAFDRMGAQSDAVARGKLLADAYQAAYKHSAIVFRSGAREALQALLDRGLAVVVVTNSSTAHVQHKIDQLGLRPDTPVQVFGNAMKFWVDAGDAGDPRFDSLPDRETSDQLRRPVWLRRNRYFARIAELLAQHRADATQLAVCGDIYELDLALPRAMGAKVALMRRQNTYGFETELVGRAGDRGIVLDDLLQLNDWL